MARWICAVAMAFVAMAAGTSELHAAGRPNILWIIVEDMSAHFSCYGEKTITTRHVDRLAAEGTLFRRAFVTAPICSISRSALMTGMYQTTIGAHHHRSGRGELKIELPADVRLAPALFKEAGYYVANGGKRDAQGRQRGKGIGKTDYNFQWDASVYDGPDWSGRKPGQPFFAQVQLNGGKLRGDGKSDAWRKRALLELGSNVEVRDVTLPPYYPRHPAILEDWAAYLDAVRYTDKEVGQIVQRLRDEGILEQTVIFFITDHGVSHARGKQFLYDEGTHIPFIVRGPGVARGKVREDLIQHMDMAATSLALAGIAAPARMQARDVLAAGYEPRRHVFAARDRADETVDHIRMVRTERYKYIRNYLPNRPYLQPNNYKDNKAIIEAMREWAAAGKLDAAQSLIMAQKRPAEELYDVRSDPHELRNLAADPAHAGALAAMRTELGRWEQQTADRGRTPEPAAMYDSDMAAYLGDARKQPERAESIRRNIALMKRWAAEGR